MTSEDYLRAVHVNGPKLHEATVYLAPYDPRWPADYQRLAERVRRALGGRVVLLEHVGSTAVPGLSAKPVIDMVLAVPDSSDEASYVPALEARGFRLTIREPDWFQHRLLKGPDIASNLHVFCAGCEEIERMIALRDWLRGHDDERDRYEAAKRALAGRVWRYLQHYADAKSDIVRSILAAATKQADP